MALTIYGIISLTFMMAMYALERRGSIFVLAFAFGCGLSSTYGFLSGAWPFGVVEAIWTIIAIRRYRGTTNEKAVHSAIPVPISQHESAAVLSCQHHGRAH
jgi:hypothetical protein